MSAVAASEVGRRKSGPFAKTRNRKACGGIHIEDPIDPTPIRQAPPQGSSTAAGASPTSPAKAAEPSSSVPNRRKRGFNSPKMSG
jgi:hypothetical protein